LKVSEYIAEFLRDLGVKNVYVVQGGAALHLIHAIDDTPGLDFVCMQHEQAAAMAADAQARITGNFGAAIATSGPGATNLITGICCAYYDSIPVIFITGQVATFRNKGNTGVRQIGFQETEIVPMVQSITNYAVYVEKAEDIRYELEKACSLAKYGRPGPVLIDIPDNIQREEVDPITLKSFEGMPNSNDSIPEINDCVELIKHARRPVFIYGAGVYASGARNDAVEMLQATGIPMAPTWAVGDLLRSDHPLYIGTFGTHGTRYANYAVQNADLIISVGCRLDTKATGSPASGFAREAKKIMVDVDKFELNKFKKFDLPIDITVNVDAKIFLSGLKDALKDVHLMDYSVWLSQITDWKSRYPICPDNYFRETNINPYVFVKELSKNCRQDERIVIDTGCCVAWMMQAFDFKKGQRLLHDWNNTAMGWAIPASIGVAKENPDKSVICVVGDGSLQMNIQELATIKKHNLPIKIFVLNNHGYSMIQQTQDQWMGSKYAASSVDHGMPDPDFLAIASAYGFSTINMSTHEELIKGIPDLFKENDAVFCNIEIDSSHRVIPQAKFGFPNEDQEPLLAREEFSKNMLINPLPVSKF
jgi:acetolactate synthase-1/2/3 large subunit